MSSDGIAEFKEQNYDQLKQDCVANKTLFCDPAFPPKKSSLIYSKSVLSQKIQWKRPQEICKHPTLFLNDVSEHDLIQGDLGNCWFVAACSSLIACHKHIWKKLIPNCDEQDWDSNRPDHYAGIFHFHFWHYGRWVDVVVDDFLPTVDNKLIYLHSESDCVFWSALFEKAYAKLLGCYEALDGGELAEAIEDFTGGISEPVDLVALKTKSHEEKDALFVTMLLSMGHNDLMCASIPAASAGEMEEVQASGLMLGHAYGITDVRRVHIKGTGWHSMFATETLDMVRLRNPWDQDGWNGRFSPGSNEWSSVAAKDKKVMQIDVQDDGEFCYTQRVKVVCATNRMLFEDFCSHFHNLVICRVVNTHIFSTSRAWHESLFHSEWTEPDLCGGCLKNKDTFWCNPQFIFDLHYDDEIVASLMQKYEHGSVVEELSIGFTVMKVEQNRRYRVKQAQQVIVSSPFKKGRSVFLRTLLTKGRYLLVPCTYAAQQTGAFLLRIYSGVSHWARELFHHSPPVEDLPAMCCCFKPYPVVATQVTLLGATDLILPEGAKGTLQPYCVISCQDEDIHSPVWKHDKNPANPEWNIAAIFYRKKPHTVISFEVWSLGLVCDELIGEHALSHEEETAGSVLHLPLYRRRSIHHLELDPAAAGDVPPVGGMLTVRIINSFDLAYI